MRRRHRNSNLPFMFGAFAGLLCVMTVGYAVFSTNLNINVKGNIVKKVITFADLKKLAVLTGDGLYADGYDPGNENYRYRGTNPDNYIKFNDELWRIISLESDGTLKIIKKDSIVNKEWDTSGSNDWARPSTLNTYLNNDYYSTLSVEAKSLITQHDFAIGPVARHTEDISLFEQVKNEKSVIWNGYIGLVNVSDVLRSNSNGQCTKLSQNQADKDLCKTTRYILPATGEEMWTISKNNDSADYAFGVYVSGNISNVLTNKGIYGIYPVVYLKAEWKLSGEGTENNPYTIDS